jgi:hypothetical protein
MTLRTGTIGNITAGTSGFKAEVRGLVAEHPAAGRQGLRRRVRREPGDARCKIDLGR